MPDTRAATSRTAFAAVVLVVLLGLGLWALYRVTAESESHSYSPGAVAPTYVHVTSGTSYTLSLPDGVRAVTRARLDPSTLRCSLRATGGTPADLPLTPEQKDTKATHQIATFVAPSTGRVHVDCPGLPPVFIDDADDAGADVSGLWLILTSVALAVGIPLTLSVLRRPDRRLSSGQAEPTQ